MLVELRNKYCGSTLSGGASGILGLLAGGSGVDVSCWTISQFIGWLGFGVMIVFGVLVWIGACLQKKRGLESSMKSARSRYKRSH